MPVAVTAASDQVMAAAADLARVSAELGRLAGVTRRAETALFAQLAARYRHGDLALEELAVIFLDIRPRLTPGWTKRWEEYLPHTRGRIQQLIADEDHGYSRAPNAPAGAYRGAWPLARYAPRPALGVSCVYVLYLGDEIIYYGSTHTFVNRLRGHEVREGRRFTRWLAYPFADRELAYRVEDRLLKRRLPSGNVRAGRLWASPAPGLARKRPAVKDRQRYAGGAPAATKRPASMTCPLTWYPWASSPGGGSSGYSAPRCSRPAGR